MITERDKDIILQCAKRYNVSYIVLFGSSIHGESIQDESIRKDRLVAKHQEWVTRVDFLQRKDNR